MHQSLYEKLIKFHEEAEAGHPGDVTVKLISHMLLHVLKFFHLHHVPLGLHRNPLALAGMLGDLCKAFGGNRKLSGDAFPFDSAQGTVRLMWRGARRLSGAPRW